MRIGCCLAGAEVLPERDGGYTLRETLLAVDAMVMNAGFDYTETTVSNVLALSEEDVAFLNEKKKASEFHLEVCNCFIPGDLPICAGEKREELIAFVEKAMRRMQALGVNRVVFGSGGARRIPEDMNRDAAYDELAWFLSMCGDLGVHYGVIVAIEPLNQKECNVFNTVAETSAMLRRVKRVGLRFVADSYHMECENEDLSVLEENRDFLSHVHIAASTARRYPGTVDAPYLSAFAEKLHGIGYTGRVTVEAHTSDYANELKTAAAYARARF